MPNSTRCVPQMLLTTASEGEKTPMTTHAVPLDNYRYLTRRDRSVPDENKQACFIEPTVDLATRLRRSRLTAIYDGEERCLRSPREVMLREKTFYSCGSVT